MRASKVGKHSVLWVKLCRVSGQKRPSVPAVVACTPVCSAPGAVCPGPFFTVCWGGRASAYLGTACLEDPCFASSCGNALYVPLKSFAVYSFGHNIHICEVYQLQKTQLSSRPQLNIGLMCNGNACNTIIIKKAKKKKKTPLLLRAKSLMD